MRPDFPSFLGGLIMGTGSALLNAGQGNQRIVGAVMFTVGALLTFSYVFLARK